MSKIDDDTPTTLQQWDTLLHNRYDRHDDLSTSEDIDTNTSPQWLLPPDVGLPLVPADTSDISAQTESPTTMETPISIQIEAPSTIESATSTDPIEPQQLQPERSVQFNLEDNDTSRDVSSQRPNRTRRLPSRLRDDFVLDSHRPRTKLSGMLGNLSKQVKFSPSCHLPKTRGEVLNHQRISSLDWTNMLSSFRNGIYGALERNTTFL